MSALGLRRLWRRARTEAAPRGELALVYRGGASLPGCPEAAARLVTDAGLAVRYVGEHERVRVSRDAFDGVTLYVHPGGGELEDAWSLMRRHRALFRSWVADGGHYLGICLGAYLAGTGPGLGLLPGDTDQYITAPSTTVRDTDPAVITVSWRGQPREVYFQDGPRILLDRGGRREAEILARYPNGDVAAALVPRGRGRVGVVGVHTEATPDWFADSGLPCPERLALDLGVDFVHALLAP